MWWLSEKKNRIQAQLAPNRCPIKSYRHIADNIRSKSKMKLTIYREKERYQMQKENKGFLFPSYDKQRMNK